jgi:hypothetical protein
MICVFGLLRRVLPSPAVPCFVGSLWLVACMCKRFTSRPHILQNMQKSSDFGMRSSQDRPCLCFLGLAMFFRRRVCSNPWAGPYLVKVRASGALLCGRSLVGSLGVALCTPRLCLLCTPRLCCALVSTGFPCRRPVSHPVAAFDNACQHVHARFVILHVLCSCLVYGYLLDSGVAYRRPVCHPVATFHYARQHVDACLVICMG